MSGTELIGSKGSEDVNGFIGYCIRVVKKLYRIPSILIDGAIAMCISFLVFWQVIFGGDEAAKIISSTLLFWMKACVGSIAIALQSLQSFRSKLFSEHVRNKEEERKRWETHVFEKGSPQP